MKDNKIIISSVREYIEVIFDMFRKGKEHGEKKWFFRGQKNSEWDVRPYVFRNNRLSNETTVINEAIRQCPADFRECNTNFEKLTKLQHYGVGTRLLDLTLNPLVALYFATEECKIFNETEKKYELKDGAIFFQQTYSIDIDSVEARIGCFLPFINLKDHNTIEKLHETLKVFNITNTDETYRYLQSNNFENLIKTLQTNYFILSSHNNDRLIKQSGAFMLPNSINIFNKKIEKAHCDLRSEFSEEYFFITPDSKEMIRDELNFLNINEATLFPELEHQMKYIDRCCHLKTSGVAEFFTYAEEKAESDKVVLTNRKIKRIVKEVLPPEIGAEISKKIVEVIKDITSLPDWNNKESIMATLRLRIAKQLVNNTHLGDKKYSLEIIEKLLNDENE